MSKCKRTVLHS